MNPFTIMRAKLRVTNSIVNEGPPGEPPHSEQLTFCGVSRSGGYPEDGSDENNTFAKWSPSVSLDITIANPNLIGALRVGEEFYVDFSRPGNVTPEFAPAALPAVEAPVVKPEAPPEPLDFRQRVINEKAELDERRQNLAGFIEGEIFAGLPDPEKERLTRQCGLMQKYSDVLMDRIAAFDGEPVEAEPFKEPDMPAGDGKPGEVSSADDAGSSGDSSESSTTSPESSDSDSGSGESSSNASDSASESSSGTSQSSTSSSSESAGQ